ncbi:hypothetical protein C0995_009037, partial [Termitomyces sp. Mi166
MVSAESDDSSLPAHIPSPVEDDLDAVLRTSLWPHDPGFRELAWRRTAWWDSERIREWLLQRGYTLYLRYPSGTYRGVGMYPLNAELHEGVFPYASHEGTKPDDESILPVLYGQTSSRQGLIYLHKHRITHGDIKTDNILVNHVHIDSFDLNSSCRESLRSQGKLTYAFYDFDGSTMFPHSMSLDECRLPSYVSFDTLYDQVPGDTLQGEFDFNPFAFDVGMLGVMFCQEFQHMTRTVPMLAPLFDRMTTRDIARRFKASEALQFFEEQVIPLTPKHVLSWAPEPIHRYDAYDYYDRWKYLDPDF